MAIKFSFEGSDVKVAVNLGSIVDRIGPMLADKMLSLMTQLQKKARANTPITKVKESIRNPQAEISGTTIIGRLTWGGEPTQVQYRGGKVYDLALIFEHGTKTHAINPLGISGELGGKRQHGRGGLAKRFGAGILVWPVPYSKGDKSVIFTKYAFPKGIAAQHFMEDAIDEMKYEFIRGFEDTIKVSLVRRTQF